jgi:hypothetical protein
MAAPLGVIAPEQGRRHRFGGPQAVDMWAGSILRPVIAAHVNELRERSLPRGAASPGVLLSGSSGFRATGRGRLPRGSAINGDH